VSLALRCFTYDNMVAGGFRFPCSGHYVDAHWHRSPSQCRRPRGGGADLCGDTQQRASADDLGSGLPSALGEASTAARAKYCPAGSAAAAAGGRRGTATTVPSPLLCSPCSEAATPLVLALAVIVLLAFHPGKVALATLTNCQRRGVQRWRASTRRCWHIWDIRMVCASAPRGQ
jgi:hypothetical protein